MGQGCSHSVRRRGLADGADRPVQRNPFPQGMCQHGREIDNTGALVECRSPADQACPLAQAGLACENWRASLKWQRLKPYEKFAEMIDRHWDGIAAYCRLENKGGLTAFGLLPGRPGDSFGAGLAWSGLDQNAGYRRDEMMFQVYDQIQVTNAFYLEPALTLSSPGERSARQPAIAFTLQSTILF
jgi:hypothetical protein